MKKAKKQGFTIVELVIVIAVIAILAAVLIPTFSNIIRKSQISADVQLCRNLNTVLANANAEGRIPGSVYDVLYLENEAGYILENINPTAEGYYYAWDQEKNKIVYLLDDLETVYYPEDYTLTPGNCWITVGSAEEAAIVAGKGYNLALEKDINESIELANVVSINTLGFKCGNVTFTGAGAGSVETAQLIGQFGEISGNIGGSSIVTSGTATTLSVSGNSSSTVTIGGYVSNFTGSGVNTVVSGTGMVNNVTAGSSSSIVNNGVVINGGSSVTGGSGSNSVTNNVVSVNTKEGLESIRTQVASGARPFAGETVKLSGDINLNGIAFVPIANNSRDNRNSEAVRKNWFQGTFDGQGYSILNFSNNGFSIAGLNAGTNDSSVPFGPSQTIYNEAVYGLFGTVYNAKIKNLTVTVSVDMMIDHANRYVGDSVGGIVGFAYGNEVVFENCVVSGSVTGYDGVAAFVGRCYATNLKFINCTNNASVTGVRKTGAFCGTISGCTVTFENCVNNGNITCLGVEKDIELGAHNGEGTAAKPYVPVTLADVNSGYYKASAAYSSGSGATPESVAGLTNNGTVIVKRPD